MEDTTTGNWQTGALTVPPSLQSYKIQARYTGDDNSIVTSDHAFYVGKIIAFSGQSRVGRLFGLYTDADGQTASEDFYHYLGNRASSQDEPTEWRSSAVSNDSFDGSALIIIHNVLRAHYNMAIGFVGFSFGGGAMRLWENPDDPADEAASRLREALDEVGTFDSFIFIQGTTDAENDLDKSQYRTQLQNMVNWLRGRYTHDYPIYIQPVGRMLNSDDRQCHDIREAQLEVVADSSNTNIFQLAPGAGIQQVDDFHQSSAGNTRLGRRIAHQLKTGNLGPKLVSASRQPNNVMRLTFEHTGGTAIVYNGATNVEPENLRFFQGNTATPVTVTNVQVVDATTMDITFAGSYSDTFQFDCFPYYKADCGINNIVTDNDIPEGDTIGMPLQDQVNRIRT